MRGNLPEYSVKDPLMDSLLEASVILYAAPAGIDLDLTMERGRIYLTNLKENKPAVVRLRFLDQVWDLTLKEEAEVGIDLIKKYVNTSTFSKEEPRTDVAFYVMQGKVSVLINGYHKRELEAPPGTALMQWDSDTDEPPTPMRVPALPLIWSRQPPNRVLAQHMKFLSDILEKAKPEDAPRIKADIDFTRGQLKRTQDLRVALEESDLRNDAKSLDVALEEERENPKPDRRHLAIFALGAVGDLDKLLKSLADSDPEHALERDEAVYVLRHYANSGLEASRRLFQDDNVKKSGLLVDKYGEKVGEKVFDLLHDFKPKDLADAYGYLANSLKSDKLALRQLAFWHLLRLSVGVKLPPLALMYNPADPSKANRDEAANAWQKLVETGKLPPKR